MAITSDCDAVHADVGELFYTKLDLDACHARARQPPQPGQTTAACEPDWLKMGFGAADHIAPRHPHTAVAFTPKPSQILIGRHTQDPALENWKR